ncbi:carboxymuconolactone decarboxylase family protein [Thiomonas sp.]
MNTDASTPRISWDAFEHNLPTAPAALRALGKTVDDSGLDKRLTELIKLRVSQINGCAYCIQYHLNQARRLGVPDHQLDLVAAWRDAGVFTARECAALTTAIATINAWNRIAGTLRFTPPIPSQAHPSRSAV